nr:hypothetical protein [Streptomyces chrestomyceticus]
MLRPRHLHGLFPYLPPRPTCNKCLRTALDLVKRAIQSLAADTNLWRDPVWIADSTPAECARSRETVKRSDLAGWVNYGHSRSHSRVSWGLQMYLVCALAGPLVTWVLANPRPTNARCWLPWLTTSPNLPPSGPACGLWLADKGYLAAELDRFLAARNISLLWHSCRNHSTPRPEAALLKTVR